MKRGFVGSPRRRDAARLSWWTAVVVRVARRYLSSDAGTWATNIAWNALFSFIPILLLLATVAGVIFRNGRLEVSLAGEVAPIFHATAAQALTVFNAVRDKFWLLAATGIVGLIWSGSSLFSCVDCGLSRLAGYEPRPFVRRRRRAMGMTVVFCLLLIPLVASSSSLAVSRHHLVWLSALGRFGRPGLFVAQFLLGTAMATTLLLYVYLLSPNRGFRQQRRRLLPGALTAGILLELLTLIVPAYLGATESSGGALLLLALPVLLTFFYCVGNIIVIGHLVNLETGDAVATRPAQPLPTPIAACAER
jgi:YihY family inner membrane protein